METINKGDLLIRRNGDEYLVTGIKEELFHVDLVRIIHLSDGSSFMMDSTDKLSDWGIVKVVRNGST